MALSAPFVSFSCCYLPHTGCAIFSSETSRQCPVSGLQSSCSSRTWKVIFSCNYGSDCNIRHGMNCPSFGVWGFEGILESCHKHFKDSSRTVSKPKAKAFSPLPATSLLKSLAYPMGTSPTGNVSHPSNSQRDEQNVVVPVEQLVGRTPQFQSLAESPLYCSLAALLPPPCSSLCPILCCVSLGFAQICSHSSISSQAMLRKRAPLPLFQQKARLGGKAGTKCTMRLLRSWPK